MPFACHFTTTPFFAQLFHTLLLWQRQWNIFVLRQGDRDHPAVTDWFPLVIPSTPAFPLPPFFRLIHLYSNILLSTRPHHHTDPDLLLKRREREDPTRQFQFIQTTFSVTCLSTYMYPIVAWILCGDPSQYSLNCTAPSSCHHVATHAPSPLTPTLSHPQPPLRRLFPFLHRFVWAPSIYAWTFPMPRQGITLCQVGGETVCS